MTTPLDNDHRFEHFVAKYNTEWVKQRDLPAEKVRAWEFIRRGLETAPRRNIVRLAVEWLVSHQRLTAAAIAAVIFTALLYQLWSQPRNPGAQDSIIVESIDAHAKPLHVVSLELTRLEASRLAHSHKLGSMSYHAMVNDSILVSVRLNREAYFYVLAFNPNGTHQLWYPSNGSIQPELTDHIGGLIDSEELEDAFRLTDGTGLQAFVVIASDQPLPPFDTWRCNIDETPWQPVQVAQNTGVWEFNGNETRWLGDGLRSLSEASASPRAFTELCNYLKSRPELSLVFAQAFPVLDGPKKQPQILADRKTDSKAAKRLIQEIERLQLVGRFKDAIPLNRELLRLRERESGVDHWMTADAKCDLDISLRLADQPEEVRIAVGNAIRELGQSVVNHRNGNFQEAERQCRQSLEIFTDAIGKQNPLTANATDMLGVIIGAQGRFSEAADCHAKAREVNVQTFGNNHPDTARSLSNLAVSLDRLSQYARAEAIHREAEEIAKSTKHEHRLALCSGAYATHLHLRGMHSEAEIRFRQVLDIRQRIDGDSHVETALAWSNLANNLDGQNRFEEAESSHRQALTIERLNLGDDHPDVAQRLHDLACNLDNQNRYGEAERLHQRAIAIREQTSGPEAIAQGLNSLAMNLDGQGKHVTAEALHRRALRLYERSQPSQHMHIAQCHNNLGMNLTAQGKLEEADQELREALTICRAIVGESHSHTATCLNNLAKNLLALGKYADAENLFRQALATSQATVGTTHTLSASIMFNLANCLVAQGRDEQAEPFFRDATQSHEAARLRTSSGIGRAQFTAKRSFSVALAACLLRLHKTEEAWRFAEASLRAVYSTIWLHLLWPNPLTRSNAAYAVSRPDSANWISRYRR